MSNPSEDIIISYHNNDEPWAHWIFWQLKEAGYAPRLAEDISRSQRWQEDAARNADYCIVLISPHYMDIFNAQTGLAIIFDEQPEKFLPIEIQKNNDLDLFQKRNTIQLFGCDEQEARNRLLAEISRRRSEPQAPPAFPGATQRPKDIQPTFPEDLPPIWTIEQHRNPIFVPREQILKELHDNYKDNQNEFIYIQALYGICGCGKTEIAREYAYQHKEEYRTVLWIDAHSEDSILDSIMNLSKPLHLSIAESKNYGDAILCMKNWLSAHTSWLLVLDYVNGLKMVIDMLPQNLKGHVLLTSRTHISANFIRNIHVDALSVDDGALLVLRRIRKIDQKASLNSELDTDTREALKLSNLMGGLPLALDQAAAYIDDKDCNLEGYLERYQDHPFELLNIRGGLHPEHPDSFATAILQDFQEIERMSPAAAELLRFCTFLDARGIPEAVILHGADELGPVLGPYARDAFMLDEPIAILRRFALVRRRTDVKTLVVHPLIQTVLQHAMDEGIHRWWSERTIRAIHLAISSGRMTFHISEFHSHLSLCFKYIKRWNITSAEAKYLLLLKNDSSTL
jgi:hypothetical protein